MWVTYERVLAQALLDHGYEQWSSVLVVVSHCTINETESLLGMNASDIVGRLVKAVFLMERL